MYISLITVEGHWLLLACPWPPKNPQTPATLCFVDRSFDGDIFVSWGPEGLAETGLMWFYNLNMVYNIWLMIVNDA